MNIDWGKFPFLRFIIAFVLGIISVINDIISEDLVNAFSFLILLYIGVWFSQKKKFSVNLKPILGVLSILIIFCFGSLITKIRTERVSENHIFNIEKLNSISGFKGVIIDNIKQTDKSFKTKIKLISIYADSNWVNVEGQILCYFKKDSSLNLKYGDKLIINARINELSEPKNPEEFNYKKYLSFHNIHHQAYIKKEDFVIISNDLSIWGSPNWFINNSIIIRNNLELILKKHFINNRELGIVKALVLGLKNELEDDITTAYSGVGAMHVLAVSGLHVGLVYQVFIIIFGWLSIRGLKTNRVSQAIILLSFIWIYAFITGLSPSVLRAACMFSFIIIGNALNRKTNIYNTLAVSAFCLLCYNPYLLVEVGFQLSYLAVIGIVYFQPKIYKLLTIKLKVIDSIWSITCVSIAAQIATLPISILYFHQFPTYFFISNIIVIPAAIIILYSGLSLLLFSWIEPIANVLSYLLEKFVWLVNEIIIIISQLPHSLIDELNISILESSLLYAIIITLSIFIYKKKIKYLIFSVYIIGVFSSFQIIEISNQNKKKEIIFYSVGNSTAVGLRENNSLVLIADSNLIENDDKLRFHLKNHWWKENIKNIKYHSTSELSKVHNYKAVVWNNKSILLYNSALKDDFKSKLDIDYLVIQNNVWIDKDRINKNFNYSKILIDGTNNWKTTSFASKIFDKSINLKEEGAQIFSIN